MKSILLTAIALLPLAVEASAQAYGSGVDGQSVFRVSDTQTFSISSSSARSTILASDTRVFRIVCTTDCHPKVGNSSVTATPSDTLLPAFSAEYFKKPENQAAYVAVIRESADGKVFIDQMKP